MTIRIVLFRRAFNPLTKGHVICAKKILKHGFNKVWFVPCNISDKDVLKYIK